MTSPEYSRIQSGRGPGCRNRTIVEPLVTAFLVFFLSGPLLAGNGSFDSGEFNYCVSVRFNASAAQLTQIRTAFQNGSDVLADATDSQHRFGTITIVNDSGASQSAEYWVNDGGGRAFATFGQYGVRGEHVNMYIDDNFQASSGADGDAYTVAHEHIHHAYGVADEYSGPSGAAEDAPAPDTATTNYSIMDNYFTRGGNAGAGTTYTLNEMCVASNHDPDSDTWQEDRNSESAWETVAGVARFPITAPAGLPVSAAPASQAVTFVEGFGGLRAMLVLDRSGSMAINQRLEFAKLGAGRFVDLLAVGDGVGVASFASSGSVNSALATIAGDAERNTAKAAINGLAATGSTNIGGGLQVGLGQLTAQATRSCNEIIVLLSDGDHNTGTPPASVIPQLQQENVTVLSVGVGSGLSTSGEATLQSVATQTGGRFFRVASAADLTTVFIQLAAETTGSGILAQAPQALSSSESIAVDVDVEAGVQLAVFAMTQQLATDDITLSLRMPSGGIILASTTDPNVNVITGPNSTIFQVTLPEAGTWQMLIDAGVVTNGLIDTLAFAQHDGVQLNLSVAKDVLTFPEAVSLSASPLFNGLPVVGATVAGVVHHPSGIETPITLSDNGVAPDALPSDGIYAAQFSAYSDDGTYNFHIQATVAGATTYAGESLFIDQGAPSNSVPVPDFVRQATTTAVVSGVPDFVPATIEFGPEVINLRSRGKYVTAYIELPEDFDPYDIDVSSLEITAIDSASITPIPARTKWMTIDDFDADGIPDLMVKFSRSALHSVLTPGAMVNIEVQGQVDDQLLVGSRSVGVINPGN
jgi:hypothetical protein